MDGLPLLSIVLFLPLAGAVLALFVPGDQPGTSRRLALVVSGVTFLVSLLLWFGFATGTYGADPADGLRLADCRIANAVRCLPPENKPLPIEFTACRPFLQSEIAAMPRARVILALGKGAHDQALRALAVRPASAYPFIHGRLHTLPNGLMLADSYHCSRYNTNTGRLTTAMFYDVFAGIRRVLPPV